MGQFTMAIGLSVFSVCLSACRLCQVTLDLCYSRCQCFFFLSSLRVPSVSHQKASVQCQEYCQSSHWQSVPTVYQQCHQTPGPPKSSYNTPPSPLVPSAITVPTPAPGDTLSPSHDRPLPFLAPPRLVNGPNKRHYPCLRRVASWLGGGGQRNRRG